MNKLITVCIKKVKCLHVSLRFFSSIKQKCILCSLGNTSVCCYASRSTHHCRSGLLSVENTIQKHPQDLFPYETDLNDPVSYRQHCVSVLPCSHFPMSREYPKGDFKASSPQFSFFLDEVYSNLKEKPILQCNFFLYLEVL